MKNDFEMYAQKVDGAIHVAISGQLDVSRALDILRFLNLYARKRQPIVMDICGLSAADACDLDVLEKGLRRLSDLGHPIMHGTPQGLVSGDQGASPITLPTRRRGKTTSLPLRGRSGQGEMVVDPTQPRSPACN